MRIRISHTTTYNYDTPPSSVTQKLRLTPRNHDGQYVIDWRIELSDDSQLTRQEDAFGNVTHTFTVASPPGDVRIAVEGTVDTQDTNGVIHDTIERFPPNFFLRQTPLTEPSDIIIDFVAQCRRSTGNAGTLVLLHNLMRDLNSEITFDINPTHTATTAAESFLLRRGVCQDIAHIFLSAARHLRIPARYVSGYFHRIDGVTEQDAGHAWVEAYIENFGWVAFDPTNGICTADAHIRVAIGLDYLGAAPVRGARYGGSGETLHVAVAVEQARQQIQH